ncbi:unnamed protein product [Musa hybrid cultivar]
MGHHCCNKQKVRRGLWSPEEDEKLIRYITSHGHSCWSTVAKEAGRRLSLSLSLSLSLFSGLQRCGKSCRLRWINYLRPDLKRGSFSAEDERIVIDVHRILGNKWAQIAKHLPGRTDNEVKNFWNSCIKKKLLAQGLDPKTHNLIPGAARSTGANSAEPPRFRYAQSSTCTPFTISSSIKSFDNMNNSMDLNPPASFHETAAPVSNFQYQDNHVLMSFKDQNGFSSSSSSLDYTNIASSSFHQPGFIDDCMWDSSVEPLQALRQIEVGHEQGVDQLQVQPSVCKMFFNEANKKGPVMEISDGNGGGGATFNLEMLDNAWLPCGELSSGSFMDQLQWDYWV